MSRAVDHWFEEPAGDQARRIRAPIDKRNAAAVAELEVELFNQRRLSFAAGTDEPPAVVRWLPLQGRSAGELQGLLEAPAI